MSSARRGEGGGGCFPGLHWAHLLALTFAGLASCRVAAGSSRAPPGVFTRQPDPQQEVPPRVPLGDLMLAFGLKV